MVGCQQFRSPFNRIGAVRIEGDDRIMARGFNPLLHRASISTRNRMTDDAGSGGLGQLSGSVGRTVVNDDDLDVRPALLRSNRKACLDGIDDGGSLVESR